MTARFGRNKRRAAREAVAAATKLAEEITVALDRSVRREREANERFRSLSDEVDELVRMMAHEWGNDFHLIPFSRQRVLEMDFGYSSLHRWHVLPKMVAGFNDMGKTAPLDTTSTTVDVFRLVSGFRRDQDRMRYEIMVASEDRMKRRSIAFSFEAFRKRGGRMRAQEVDWLLADAIQSLKRDLMDGGLVEPR